MKYLGKRQAIILIVLNAAAIIMAAVLIFSGILKKDVFPAGGTPEEWKSARDPRPSLNEHIKWETNFGGSDNETLTAVYRDGDDILIFGNTTSSSHDFGALGEGEHGYIAKLSKDGKTQSFTPLEPMTAVTLHENGYLIALKNETAVMTVNAKGEILKKTAFGGVFSERIIDLKMTDSGYAAVVRIENETVQRAELKVVCFDNALTVKSATALSRSSSLEYVDLFETSKGLILAANYVSELVNCLSFIEITGVVYHEVTAEFGYRAVDVVPYGYGWAALIVDQNGFGNVLEIGSEYTKKSLRYLNVAKATEGTIVATGNYYYVYIHVAADVSILAVFDVKFDYLGLVDEAANLSGLYSFYLNGRYATFFGQTSAGTKVISADGKSVSSSFMLSVQAANHRFVKTTAGPVLVAELTDKGADCGAHLGGSDIWVALLS